MDKNFFIISWNHHHIPLKYRELLSLDKNNVKKFIRLALEHSWISEISVLSTCNRIEIHVISHDIDKVMSIIESIYETIIHQEFNWEKNKPEIFANLDAFKHLCLVSSGFDSMAFGENQITAQVKNAQDLLINSQPSAKTLDYFYVNALMCSSKIRSRFSGKIEPSSVSGLIIEKIKTFGKPLNDLSVLILGAGESASLTAKLFKKRGAGQIFIANRNTEKSTYLSKMINGSYISIDEINETLSSCDILVAATHSDKYLIDKKQIEGIMVKRKNNLLFFDISSPRNIDPSIAEINDVFLYDLDSLKINDFHDMSEKKIIINSALDIIEKYFIDKLDISEAEQFEVDYLHLDEAGVV